MIELAKILETLNISVLETTKLFSLPETYTSLTNITTSSLNNHLTDYKSIIEKEYNIKFNDDEEFNSYLKNSPEIKLFKSISYNQYALEKEIDSCINLSESKKTQKILESIGTFQTANEFVKSVESNSELNDIENNNKTSLLDYFKNNKINTVVFVSIIMSYIIYELIQEISKSKFPSPSRTSYLKKSTQYLYNDMTAYLGENNKEWKKSKGVLKTVYVSITALLLMAALYKFNRSKQQKESVEVLKDLYKDSNCVIIEEANDYPINPKLFPDKIPLDICDIEEPGSDNPIKTISFDEKLNSFSCNIEVEENIKIIDASEKIEISKALIEASFSSINVSKDSIVNEKTILGVVSGESVYSPIIGKVSLVEKNKVFIHNVSISNNNIIAEKTLKLNDLYVLQNNAKDFIKKYYLEFSYPTFLANSLSISKQLTIEDINALPNKNISEIYNRQLKKKEQALEIYEKNIQIITGKDNVQKQSEENTLQNIKNAADNEESTFLSRLTSYYANGKNDSNITVAFPSEYSLIDYYEDLLNTLYANKSKSEIITNFIKLIYNIVIRRYFNDGFDKDSIKKKINDFSKQLQGISDDDTNKYFEQIDNIWNSSQKYNKIENFLIIEGNKNKSLSSTDVFILVDKIVYLYKFYRDILNLYQNKTAITSNNNLTFSESINIEGYFNNVLKILKNSQTDINNAITDLQNTIVPIQSSVITLNDEQYLYYKIIKEEDECGSIDNEDPYLSTKTSSTYKDINYWFKYCSMATLAGVANVSSWSTGVILPSGPLLLPVVYIPIKAFEVSFGVLLLGISICGIYPFPFLYVGNLANYSSLPISLNPNTSNFSASVKNPKPKIEIADKLNETIDNTLLNEITSKFKTSNEDFVSTTFTSKETQYKNYLSKLSSSMSLIIKNDAFPKYENLKSSNVAFSKYLASEFVMKGGVTYGIPGNLPLPTS